MSSNIQLNSWDTTLRETIADIIPSWYLDILEANQKKVKCMPVGPRNVP